MTGDTAQQESPPSHIAADLFRHEYGRLVAYATRLLGPNRLDLAEDIVSESLYRALKSWPTQGIPREPAAWLFVVTRNQALSILRSGTNMIRASDELLASVPAIGEAESTFADELNDATLAMMYACADPAIGSSAQIALILKELCGFSVNEIAAAYLEEPATVSQRLVRAKAAFRKRQSPLTLPPPESLLDRTSSVLSALYLLFNEGYYRHHGELLIDQTQCHEAIRLATMIMRNPRTQSPQVAALLALFSLHAARLPARVNSAGDLLLLENQDRQRWDQQLLSDGFHWLRAARAGSALTRFHLEAGIAACHASAATVEETDWKQIVQFYDDLLRLDDSPVLRLNRAVALSRTASPEAGLIAVSDPLLQIELANYLPWHMTRGALAAAAGEIELAKASYEAALAFSHNDTQRRFIAKKLSEISSAQD